jgi:hypothetical protein
MASVDYSISQAAQAGMPRDRSGWRLRPPWHRDAWSATEIALALQAQRGRLLSAAARRSDARGVPRDLLEELVNEAICAVVMMSNPIASEEHLVGAFWTALRLLLRHHREGRRRIRVGARSRVDFECAALYAATDDPTAEEGRSSWSWPLGGRGSS